MPFLVAFVLRKGSKLFWSHDLPKASMGWASLYSRRLFYYYLCVDEVPAPRSRPTTVRQGNGVL
jgi:hypothetical protein